MFFAWRSFSVMSPPKSFAQQSTGKSESTDKRSISFFVYITLIVSHKLEMVALFDKVRTEFCNLWSATLHEHQYSASWFSFLVVEEYKGFASPFPFFFPRAVICLPLNFVCSFLTLKGPYGWLLGLMSCSYRQKSKLRPNLIKDS